MITLFKDKNLQFFVRMGLPKPVPEYRFHPTRKWRFDYAFVEYKIALEVEGGIWSGGRHTTPEGFYNDMEKYNKAACMGWRVLRVTPEAVNTLISVQLVKEAIGA